MYGNRHTVIRRFKFIFSIVFEIIIPNIFERQKRTNAEKPNDKWLAAQKRDQDD